MMFGLMLAADVIPWALYVMREPVVPPGDIRNALEIPVTAMLLAIALRQPLGLPDAWTVAAAPVRTQASD